MRNTASNLFASPYKKLTEKQSEQAKTRLNGGLQLDYGEKNNLNEDQVLPQFFNFSNNEKTLQANQDASRQQQEDTEDPEEEGEATLTRNTQFNTRVQIYDSLPLQESSKLDAGQQLFDEQNQGNIQNHQKQKTMQGQQGQWENTNKKNDKMQLTEEQNIKCSIEIKGGVPQRSLNNFHKNQNALVLNNYTGIWGILIFLHDTVFQFDHVVLLLHFCAHMVSGIDTESAYNLIFIACATFIGTGLLNFVHDRNLKQAADKVNSKPVEKFIFTKRHKSFQISDWGSIQTGDIIKIKQNQEIPCDALILNIIGSKAEHQTCYQRGSLWCDAKAPTLKSSYQGTMNRTGNYISDSKFVESISGLIKWEYNHRGYFTGDFKQVDNPAAFELLPQNIVLRGCYVSHCQQIICLALNVGLSSMGHGFRNPEQIQMRIKNSLLQKKILTRPEGVQFRALRSVQMFALIFCITPAILILFEQFALKNTSMGIFQTVFIDLQPRTGFEQLQTMVEGVASFMSNLPYLSHIIMEAVVYFHAYFVLWDINLVPANIMFTNLRTMKTLGQVDTIVCSKAAFINPNLRYVAAFKVGDVVAYNEADKKRQKLDADNRNEVQSQNSSDSNEQENRETLEYLPNQTCIVNYFQSTVANQLLEHSHPRHEDFTEFLLALSLCHHAITQKSQSGQQQQGKLIYKSLYKEEESQLQFADSYGFQFKIRYNRMLTIFKQGSLQRFEECIIRKFKYQDDWITIQVIKPFQTFQSGVKIYYKGNLRVIQQFLRKDINNNLENDIEKFQKEGIHAIGIAKRDIEAEEAAELTRILQENNSKKSSDDTNDMFLLQLAQNLDFLGVIGMMNVTNTRDALLMEEMRKNGVKLVILSTDTTAENITDLNSLKMFNQYRDPININGRTDRQIEESLMRSLKQVVEKRMIDSQFQNANGGDFSASNNPKITKKAKSTVTTRASAKQPGSSNQLALVEFFDQEQKNCVFFNGQSLQFILKDETLTKLFLTLCSFCTLLVGSSLTPYQKRDLTAAIRQFSIQGKQGYVVCVVAQQADKFISLEADITVGIQKNYQQSDLLACSDVQIRDIYGISYLLFKHGTILHRRLRVVLNEFVYRTILLMVIHLFFFITSGFTSLIPYNQLFFAAHIAIFSPILYFLEGITHMDYGYGVLHRIFGEYKFNKAQNLNFLDFIPEMLSSLFDAGLLCFFYISWNNKWSNDLDVSIDGKNSFLQAKLAMNSVILTLFQYWRHRTTLCTTQMFVFLNFFILLISLVFILEDKDFNGVTKMVDTPLTIAIILFFLLNLSLKNQLRLIYTFWKNKNRLLVERYLKIEDILYMEEYEDPEEQFDISGSVAYVDLVKQIEDSKLFSINQNLLKVHRSDDIDAILDRINFSGGQSAEGKNNFTNRSIINKCNLKLNDINKEIEYNEVIISEGSIKNCVSLIWTSVTLYGILGLFKIVNQFIENNYSTSSLNNNKTQERSDTAGNNIQTIYIEVIDVLVSVLAIYLIKKVKIIRPQIIVFSLVVFYNLMVNIYFYGDPQNPLIQIQFLYTIAFSHLIRLNSVFFVSLVCLASAIGFLNIRISTIQEITNEEDSTETQVVDMTNQAVKDSQIQLVWQALSVAFYIFFWTYYTYWDEIKQKIHFVTQFRRVKELQKLKSIINILIPSIVRSRIQDGKKNFSDAQGQVTVIFIDIDNFDQIVQTYTGRELIELLDRLYNAFDSICEQYGLQKIETVGKTYMACAGLKVVEKDIDNRLLGSHHSVRVTDFACNVLSYVQTQTLRNSKKLSVKLGIHTGEVIAGVVGETKPQFSLIGPTINKTSRVCSKCPPNKILVSKETYQNLIASASNFAFGSLKIEMKGIGLEEVFTVEKRKIQRTKLIGQRRDITVKSETNSSTEDGNIRRFESDINKNSNKEEKENRTKEYHIQEQQYEDPVGLNVETFRTIQNTNSERLSSVQNDSERDRKSNMNDSYEDDVSGNVLKNNELKDDKQIVKSAALNEIYNLVERPRFLVSFELKDQENAFLHSLLKENYSLEVFQLVSKYLIDLIIIECLVYTFFGSDSYYIYAGVFAGLTTLITALLYYMRRLTQNGIMIFLMIQIVGIGISMIFFILNGPKFQNFLLRSSQQVTLGIYQAIIVISRAIPFRVFASVQIILYIALISQNFFFIGLGVLNEQTYAIDSILQLVLFALLILASHNREMKVRRQYNQQRIIEVEIEKTQELLGKLIPQHVLAGILNDQRVVDTLENVTLLYTDMVGFTEFSKNTKPQEVVNLLSRLFSKFDQLCEQIGVYKVHTIGDCYVVLSYTGKIAKERRSSAIQIEEAFKVIQVGLEMINIIAEERTKTKNPALKSLDMRIGIHTGKIVGGIIGTKVVRYDIFGQDVLIANKMESNGVAGTVCISEQTYKLLQKNNFVSNTFAFDEHNYCEIGTIGKRIKTYTVKQIFNNADQSSEESSDQGEADSQDQENRSQHSSQTDPDNENEDSNQRSHSGSLNEQESEFD